LYVKDLEIRNQITLNSADSHAYGESVRFQNVYSIETLAHVEALAKTLKSIEKTCETHRKSGCYVRDIEDLIGRIAETLKIKTFAVRTDQCTNLNTVCFKEFSINEVREEVSKLELSVR